MLWSRLAPLTLPAFLQLGLCKGLPRGFISATLRTALSWTRRPSKKEMEASKVQSLPQVTHREAGTHARSLGTTARCCLLRHSCPPGLFRGSGKCCWSRRTTKASCS